MLLLLFATLVLGARSEIVDLTLPLTPSGSNASYSTSFFQWNSKFVSETPGLWYTANTFTIRDFTGTHVVMPNYITESRSPFSSFLAMHQLSPNKMILSAAKVHFSYLPSNELGYSVADFLQWERSHGLLKAGEAVLILANQQAGLSTEAVRWLVSERKVACLALGTELSSSLMADAYAALAGGSAYIVAALNLSRLAASPLRDFALVTLPGRLQGATGSPARVFALWGRRLTPSGHSLLSSSLRLVDLSLPIKNDTVNWGGSSPFTHSFPRWSDDGTYRTVVGQLSGPEHGGTHLDAPSHFATGGWNTNEIPVERLFLPAVIIDVRAKCAANRSYELTADDIRQFERRHGAIAPATLFVMMTGFTDRLPDVEEYVGAPLTDTRAYRFPGISLEAAEVLVERGVVAAGVDTPSLDYGQSRLYPVHQRLSKLQIYGLENLANLGHVKSVRPLVMVGVWNLEGGSGGPARVIAVDSEFTTSGARRHGCVAALLWLALVSAALTTW